MLFLVLCVKKLNGYHHDGSLHERIFDTTFHVYWFGRSKTISRFGRDMNDISCAMLTSTGLIWWFWNKILISGHLTVPHNTLTCPMHIMHLPYIMQRTIMTPSNGSFFRVTGPLCGKFTGHRRIPLTKGWYCRLRCFFDVGPHKLLNKQSIDRWF